LERSDEVLWTIAPPGIVLHHLPLHFFLELDALGYSVWAFLDGARPVDEVVSRAVAAQPDGADALAAQEIVEVLSLYGFVTERSE
jgi:hypothetical protein